MHRLSEALAAFEVTQQYEAARDQIDRVTEELRAKRRRGQLDPVVEELKVAVTERNTSTYTTARQRAADNLELVAQLDRKLTLFSTLTAGAPELAGTLTAMPSDTVWDERAADSERAWNWSRAHAWVMRLAAPDSENSAAGRDVGDPVAAYDAQGDVLTYTLGDGADESSFDIDQATGQIMVGAGTMLDFEGDSSYTVMVTATGPGHGHRPGARPPARGTAMMTPTPSR